MALPSFKNEAEFRKEWITPFLTKLGYIVPKHVHGTNEQGKDFYFAEHDKFGHLRFCAAQVKLGKIGSGQTELDNLLNQVRRCFTVTLKYHKGADRQRISSVYIMTNESISDSAREYISDYCRQEHYGENVFYLDGETLDNLERHATYIDDKTLRNRLVALLNEATFNLQTIQKIQDSMLKGNLMLRPCRMLAVEDALRNPFEEDIFPYQGMSHVWSLLKLINDYYSSSTVNQNDLTISQTLEELFEKALDWIKKVRNDISDAIKKVNARYKLDIEIESPE